MVFKRCKGYKQVTHTGGLLEGIDSNYLYSRATTLELLYLQQSGAAFNAITNTIKDSYLGITSEIMLVFIVIALKQMRKQLIKLLMKFGQP
jgi:hypothetical protein